MKVMTPDIRSLWKILDSFLEVQDWEYEIYEKFNSRRYEQGRDNERNIAIIASEIKAKGIDAERYVNAVRAVETEQLCQRSATKEQKKDAVDNPGTMISVDDSWIINHEKVYSVPETYAEVDYLQ